MHFKLIPLRGARSGVEVAPVSSSFGLGKADEAVVRMLGELCWEIVHVLPQLSWKPRWIAQPWLFSGMKLISRNCHSERWKNCVLAGNWPHVEEEEEQGRLGSTGAAGELLAPSSSFPSLLGPETWSDAQLDHREDLNLISC